MIVFGKLHILEGEETLRAIRLLAEKYSPAVEIVEREKEIKKFQNTLCVLELSIQHMSGKQAKELVKES